MAMSDKDNDRKKNVGADESSDSVNELVNRLRDNISSAGSAPAGSEKTISKKGIDPDKDIASMLKKFMPDENADEAEEFELDETPEEQTSEFELEGDGDAGDYDVDTAPLYDDISDDDIDMDIEGVEPAEAGGLDIDDVTFTDGSDFDEPMSEMPKVEPHNKKRGRKRKSLAGAYAEMLKGEYGTEENETKSADVQKNAENEVPAAPETSEVPETPVSEVGTARPEPENENDGEKTDYNYESISDAEMPDFSQYMSRSETEKEPEKEAENTAAPEKAEVPANEEPKVTEIPAADVSETAEMPTAQFIKLSDAQKAPEKEKEDDYFVGTKKPLAFDDEDETPTVPDESAFEGEIPAETEENAGGSDKAETGETKKNENLDDKDINLMVALGYEDELEKTIGKQNVDKIADDLSSEIVDFIDVDDAYAFDGFELETPERFRVIGNKYKQEHKTMKLRLLGTGIFAVALFIFELLGMFDVTLGGALNIHHYPTVGVMLSLQLLVLAAALSWKQLAKGLLGAITFNPTPSSIPSVAVLMTVVYDIIMALAAPNTGLELYNFPAALYLLLLTTNDYLNLSREIRAFNTIATRRPKYVLTAAASGKSAEEEMNEIFAEDAHYAEEKNFEVRKTDFVENYFRRTNIRSQKDRKLNLVIYPFIALAVALGVISYVTNRSAVTAFNISILTVLLCTPMSVIFSGSLPFFGAVKKAFENDSTIIGEESVEEYSGATSVAFPDTEVFPTDGTVTRGIKLYDNNAIYYVLYHLASLYSKIGGPLKARLEQATAEMGHSENVEIVRVEDKGVEAVVDGKVRILAGQSTFMMASGITAAYDEDDEKMMNEGCSVMFLVLDGVLSAKLYVCYDIDHDFEAVIDTLAEEGTETLISTCDPNIDDELLASRLRVSRYPARIVKRIAEEKCERVEGGIVSRKSTAALASTVALCNKIKRVRKNSRIATILSIIIGVIVMVFLSLFSSKLGLHSVYVALYQIFWTIPLFLFTKLYVK